MAFCLTAETDDICSEHSLWMNAASQLGRRALAFPRMRRMPVPSVSNLSSKLPIAQVVKKGDPSLERVGNLANIGWEVVS